MMTVKLLILLLLLVVYVDDEKRYECLHTIVLCSPLNLHNNNVPRHEIIYRQEIMQQPQELIYFIFSAFPSILWSDGLSSISIHWMKVNLPLDLHHQ